MGYKKKNPEKELEVIKKEEWDARSFEEKETEITEEFEKAISGLSLLL